MTSQKANLRLHTKLRGEMFKVFDLALDNVDDECRLQVWADEMGLLLAKIYDEKSARL